MEGTGHTAIFKQAFQGLDSQALLMLRKVAVKRDYRANTVLVREGEPSDTFCLITRGRVAITRRIDGTDEDFVLGFLGPGQYFGEMAVITDVPRTATITTLADTTVLEISKEHFERIFRSSPSLARSILHTLIGIIRETDRRAIEDLEKRYQELAAAYAALEAAQKETIAHAALEAQLQVAAKAQRSLLPAALPTVEGFEFAALFEPAREVGGDFYDVRRIDDRHVAILLADVSDKGAHAALFMAVARTLFLTEARYHHEPAEVMQAVHRGLVESSAYDMFVTAIYGVLDTQTGVFRYVRAGHEEPICARCDGSVRFLGGRGRFLGLWPDREPVFEEQEVVLEPGDRLVLYSDGVCDMRNPENKPFGRDTLARLIQTLQDQDADRLARMIYNVVQKHRAHQDAFDDFTLLVVCASACS